MSPPRALESNLKLYSHLSFSCVRSLLCEWSLYWEIVTVSKQFRHTIATQLFNTSWPASSLPSLGYLYLFSGYSFPFYSRVFDPLKVTLEPERYPQSFTHPPTRALLFSCNCETVTSSSLSSELSVPNANHSFRAIYISFFAIFLR